MRGLAAAIVVALSFATGAGAQERVEWPSGAGPFYVDQVGDVCRALVVSRSFEGDIWLSVDWAGGDVIVGVWSDDWSDVEGQEFDGVFDFIGSDFEWTAHIKGVSTPKQAGYAAQFDPQILEDFAKADLLIVRRDNRRFASVNLDGSARAAAALRRCMEAVARAQEPTPPAT